MSLELWGLFASSFIASTLLPGGSEAALAWLVDDGQIPLWQLLSVAVAGNSAGGILTLILGRIISIYYPAKVLDNPRQERAKRWLQRRGAPALVVSWLPLIGDPLCLLAGWLKLNIYWCSLFIVIGKAARYLLIAGLFS
ncbi:MAG: hypothetical protein OFPI_19850 [Osedax symbiont Rs2]|nr:MAG: hypothetical protein OFPI_19850 [Osedax symbiont Rs2]